MSELLSENSIVVPVGPRSLPQTPDQAAYQGVEHGNPRHHPHRPMPDPLNGELLIDPDILLKAKKFNLNLTFFYSSRATTSREFGVGRGASFGGVISSTSTGGSPMVIRGDFRSYQYTASGSSGGITTYAATTLQGATTTLSFNGTQFT